MHIDVGLNFIPEQVQTSTLDVVYVATEENDADLLSNPLGRGLLEAINELLGLGGVI